VRHEAGIPVSSAWGIDPPELANINAGGDNCHRGAILGALLGTALGVAAIPERWLQGLAAHAELEAEIEGFISRFG
jgi:ADP-ribosyl-[dinitrogen reductase] hydrolase